VAVAYRSSTTYNSFGNTGQSIAPPSGLANDDILVYLIYKENTNAITWPSGFTQILNTTSGSGTWTLSVAWKRAASESGNYAPSWTGSTYTDGILAAYSGCVTSGSPIDASGIAANGVQNDIVDCPSITTLSANAMVIAFASCFFPLDTGVVAPSGMTKRTQRETLGLADVIQASAGSSGSKQWTATGQNDQTVGATLALKEAGGAPAGRTRPALTVTPAFPSFMEV
jgi:hypothetical protein